MVDISFLIVIVALAPAGVVLVVLFAHDRWVRREHQHRSPLRSLGLRFAGYSTAQEADRLSEKMTEYFLVMVLAPMMLLCIGFGLLATGQITPNYLSLMTFLGTSVSLWNGHKMFRTREKWRNYKRGMIGEMAVGNVLDGLRKEGFSVFHDIPADGFNLDHVVIGLSGVFVIETKYRRKLKVKEKTKTEIIAFDGHTLSIGKHFDTDSVAQAKLQADWLKHLLEHQCVTTVKPMPVLTFPGWWIDRKPGYANGEMFVVNEKELPTLIRGRRCLDTKTVELLSRALEAKCKDVSFE